MDEAISASVQVVLDAIPHKKTRQHVQELLHIALPALQRLSTLDERIYHCYSSYRSDHEENGTLDLMITLLRNDIFAAPNQFVHRLESFGFLQPPNTSDVSWNSEEFDLDIFDSGSHENHTACSEKSPPDSPRPIHRSSGELPQIKENEIDAAIGMLATEERDTQETWEGLKEDLGLLSRALREQLRTEEDRLRQAFHEAHYSLMIRELDTCRVTLLEGMFALVSAMFSRFLDDFDPKILPGYRNVLQQTLMARREIARLMHTTNKHNAILQDESQSEELRRNHLTQLQQMLAYFISSEAFHSLQPAHRWELVNLKQSLNQTSMLRSTQQAEGLSKFLESLHSLNQSDMLHQHDQQVKEEVKTLLEAAHSVAEISMVHAQDLLKQACESLLALYGSSSALDHQLETWKDHPPQFQSVEQLRQQLQYLRQFLR